jgi:hypothetical protein
MEVGAAGTFRGEKAYVGDRTKPRLIKQRVRGRRMRSVGLIDRTVDKRQVAWYLLFLIAYCKRNKSRNQGML